MWAMTGIGLAVGLSVLGAGWCVVLRALPLRVEGAESCGCVVQGNLRHRCINIGRRRTRTSHPHEEPHQVCPHAALCGSLQKPTGIAPTALSSAKLWPFMVW